MPVLVSIFGQTHKHSIILNESVSSTAERYAPAGVLSRFLPRNRSYLHSIRSSLPCILAERYLMETYDILSYPYLSRSNPGYHGLHSHTPFLHDEIHAIYVMHLSHASHTKSNHVKENLLKDCCNHSGYGIFLQCSNLCKKLQYSALGCWCCHVVYIYPFVLIFHFLLWE